MRSNLLAYLTKSVCGEDGGDRGKRENTKIKLRVALCDRRRIHSPLVNPLVPICEVHSRR